MKYTKAKRFTTEFLRETIMGPNPAKLLEQVLSKFPVAEGSLVLDLGCGKGVTSLLLALEYHMRVFATDLWIEPTENWERFRSFGLGAEQIVPIHAEAHDLPYANGFFDAVFCIDSYQYFGCDPNYLGEHLLPLVKHGGRLLFVVPGMKKDLHDNLPPEMLLSWRAEDIDTLHDCAYWQKTLEATADAEIESIFEMEDFDECWNEWLATDNEYAVQDRLSMNAGAGKYMNFVAMALKRK